MKKILLLLAFTLACTAGYSQLATLGAQTTGNATLTVIKQKLDTIAQNTRTFPSGTGQTSATATLTLIKKGIDTVNQNARTLATQATLLLAKKSSDTTNQYLRLGATVAAQVISTATLALIKKGADTVNQNARAISALQTIGNASLTLVKKSSDTTNQLMRATKLVLDSIAQIDKLVTYTFAANSSNAAVLYQAGDVIMDDARAIQCYSVTIGSTGNWEIVNCVMWLTASSSSTIDVNLSVYSNTVTGGNDGDAYNPSATFNSRYLGTFHLASQTPFTTSSLYTARENTGTGVGDKTVYVTATTSSKIYFVLWANTSFTPAATQTYNFKLTLKKRN